MKKSLGSKRKYITDAQREEILRVFLDFKENEFCKIYPNHYFGYTKVTIEQALKDEKGNMVIDKKTKEPKADSSLRDFERIPLKQDIDQYFEAEVKPHLENAWMDRTKDKVGYEINFTKYFYQYKPLRSLEEITADLLKLEEESDGLFQKILEK
jgi:type I restriction enzyme M protein